MFQRHDVCVRILDELSHDLQLAVFEPLVLQDFFDRHYLVCFHDLRLEDNAETTVPDDPFRRVVNILRCLPLRGCWRGGDGGRRGVGCGRRGGSCGRRRCVLVHAEAPLSIRIRHCGGRVVVRCAAVVFVVAAVVIGRRGYDFGRWGCCHFPW